MILYFWWCVTMDKYNEEFGYYTLWNKGVEDIQHVWERIDGSSDWLPEALDIDLGNWYKECSNWNLDLNREWDLEALYPEITEPTAEQLVEAFNIKKEELFPGKENLTPKEEIIVREKIQKNLNK